MRASNSELTRRNLSAQRASEHMMYDVLREEERTQRVRARQLAQDDALAQEIERRKRDNEAREREIQRICDSDPELRELQSKLKVLSFSLCLSLSLFVSLWPLCLCVLLMPVGACACACV